MSRPDEKFADFTLNFTNVEFSRGHKILFSGLSFELSSGQVLWIQGDNGIGKTSILKLALGLYTPDSGHIRMDLTDNQSSAESIGAYLGHQDAFEPLLSVTECLDFWAEIYEYDDPIKLLISKFGLADQANVRIEGLSAGQKRRLALARLSLSNRPLWILDEPKAAMDKTGQLLIDTMLADHLTRGGAALIASHDKTLPIGTQARRLLMEAK